MLIARPHTKFLKRDPTTIEETILNDRVDHPRVEYMTMWKCRLVSASVVMMNISPHGIHPNSSDYTLHTTVCVEHIALIRRSLPTHA